MCSMKVKTTRRGHLTLGGQPLSYCQEETNFTESMEEREPWYSVGRNVNGYCHYGKTIWMVFKKLKVEPSHNPAISLLSINLKGIKSLFWREIYRPKFLVVLFKRTKFWRDPSVCWQMDQYREYDVDGEADTHTDGRQRNSAWLLTRRLTWET